MTVCRNTAAHLDSLASTAKPFILAYARHVILAYSPHLLRAAHCPSSHTTRQCTHVDNLICHFNVVGIASVKLLHWPLSQCAFTSGHMLHMIFERMRFDTIDKRGNGGKGVMASNTRALRWTLSHVRVTLPTCVPPLHSTIEK